MGRIRHRALIVTAASSKSAKKARVKAKEILLKHTQAGECKMDRLVTKVVSSVVNGYHTFMIAPDGSKIGWDTSDAAEKARVEFMAWVQETSCVDAVQIVFGGDGHDAFIESCN